MGKNHKNMTFNNDMQGFKSWCKEFPPLDPEAVTKKAFQKKEDYYLELQLVEGFLGADSFVNASVREFDHENRNFEYVGMDKEKELLSSIFRNKVEHFKTRWS